MSASRTDRASKADSVQVNKFRVQVGKAQRASMHPCVMTMAPRVIPDHVLICA